MHVTNVLWYVCVYYLRADPHGRSDGRSGTWLRAHFRHSPSFRTESKSSSEMLHLGRGQGLGERVSDHVVRWAIHEAEGALLNDPANEVIAHVNVFGACMILVITGEGNGGLVI